MQGRDGCVIGIRLFREGSIAPSNFFAGLGGDPRVDVGGGFAEGDFDAALDFERCQRWLGLGRLGFALVAFFGEADAALGDDDAAFGGPGGG